MTMMGTAMNSGVALPPVATSSAVDGVLALLTLLANPEQTRSTLATLTSARDEALTAKVKLDDTIRSKAADLDVREAAIAKSETSLADARRDLQHRRDELAGALADHAENVERHRVAVEQLASDRAAHQASVQRHRDQLDALRRAVLT
jgi:chromosome segregation ATPase